LTDLSRVEDRSLKAGFLNAPNAGREAKPRKSVNVPRFDPDTGEILGDLERSIADKCAAALNPAKNVINQEDITRLLNEVGPVVADPLSDDEENDDREITGPRRLCRQPEGRMLYGVCSGLAEYFGMNVVIVRIIFLALLMFNGLGGVIHVLLRLAMPAAETAGGETPQTTHPLVLALAALLVVIAAIAILPTFAGGVDIGLPAPFPTRGFWMGRSWMGGLSLIFSFAYLVILAVVIAVGAALVKVLLARSRARQ
jgi:phage shock protein PspC (stress-responsive transcriptional regulator)